MNVKLQNPPQASADGKWYFLTIFEHSLSYPAHFMALMNRAFRFLPCTAAIVAPWVKDELHKLWGPGKR
jgi:hypothetical protein